MRRYTSFSLLTVAFHSQTALAADEAHGSGIVPEWLSHGDTNMAFLAMVVFLLIVWRFGGFKAVTTTLDKRSETIQAQLSEAKDLREAATKMLADAERRQSEAQKEAEAIVSQAQKDAESLMKDARASLAQRLERREAMAEARIQQAEADAAAEVRRAAANAATSAASILLRERAGSDQFETAAKEIETALN